MDCCQYLQRSAADRLDSGLRRMERFRGEDDVRGTRSSCNAVAGIHRTKIILYAHIPSYIPRRKEA